MIIKSLSSLSKGTLTINFIFVVSVLLPNTSLAYLIQGVFILYLISFSKIHSQRFYGNLGFVKMMFLVILLISFFYNAIVGSSFYIDSIIKIIYISLLILFFPLARNYKILKGSLIFCIVLIVLSQISYFLQISLVSNFIENYYTNDVYFNSYESLSLDEYSGDFGFLRFGGIFRNPNQCGRMVTLIYAVFLLTTSKSFSKVDFSMLIIFLFSVLLTGSRTALLVFIFLTGVRLYWFTKKKIKKFNVIILILMFSGFFLVSNFSSNVRILNFSESGTQKKSSLFNKFIFLGHYIFENPNSDTFKLLVGNFNVDNFADLDLNTNLRIERFDNEIGYLIYAFGFFGLFMIVCFYTIIFKRGTREVRFLMILMLWTLTSTILTNMRFSFVFLFILSLYYPKRIPIGMLNR
ncbi:O-antigen ligase [Flavobacteriaceae bacterium]|nr:O-antigen ligase [Flavobacteriaceae bacterium]